VGGVHRYIRKKVYETIKSGEEEDFYLRGDGEGKYGFVILSCFEDATLDLLYLLASTVYEGRKCVFLPFPVGRWGEAYR